MKSEKIKILFFQWKLVFGGTESSLFDLLKFINKEKFDVTLFVVESGGIWEEKFKNEKIRILTPYTLIEKEKCNLTKEQYLRWKAKIDKSLDYYGLGLLNICTKEKWDIIVSYHSYIYKLGVFQNNVKTLFYLHTDPSIHLSLKNNIINKPRLFNTYDGIVSVSNNSKKEFCKLIDYPYNIDVQFNPIDTDSIIQKAQEKNIIDINIPYICSVGRLDVQKGFDRLIRIHKRLIDDGFTYKLVIVGEGEERNNIEKIIKDLGVEDTVILTGYQENPYPIIKNSKFMAVSSLQEGLSMATIEAIILGVPVVASIPTAKEIFGDEPCGIVTENSEEALYVGIKEMLSNEDLYYKSKNAVEKRSQYYNIERMMNDVENVYIRLYEQKHKTTKNFFLLSEYLHILKERDLGLRHLPNRLLIKALGINTYSKIKNKIKRILAN